MASSAIARLDMQGSNVTTTSRNAFPVHARMEEAVLMKWVAIDVIVAWGTEGIIARLI